MIYFSFSEIFLLVGIYILLLTILYTESCAGISGRTQVLFAIVFLTRIIANVCKFDWYKLISIEWLYFYSTCIIIHLVYKRYRTLESDRNSKLFNFINFDFFLLPALGLSLMIHQNLKLDEILESFSIFLEAMAIIPQLLIVIRTGKYETVVNYYVMGLFGYKSLSLIYCSFVCDGELNSSIQMGGAIVQTAIYCYFFICIHFLEAPRPLTYPV